MTERVLGSLACDEELREMKVVGAVVQLVRRLGVGVTAVCAAASVLNGQRAGSAWW